MPVSTVTPAQLADPAQYTKLSFEEMLALTDDRSTAITLRRPSVKVAQLLSSGNVYDSYIVYKKGDVPFTYDRPEFPFNKPKAKATSATRAGMVGQNGYYRKNSSVGGRKTHRRRSSKRRSSKRRSSKRRSSKRRSSKRRTSKRR